MITSKTLDTIEKLIRLAVHNSDLEEARSAAYRAVMLIANHQIPIGDISSPASYRQKSDPMTPQEQVEIQEIFSAMARVNPDHYYVANPQVDFEIDDEHMKKKIVAAWRRIREVRKQLEIEINTFERETHRQYPEKPEWMK